MDKVLTVLTVLIDMEKKAASLKVMGDRVARHYEKNNLIHEVLSDVASGKITGREAFEELNEMERIDTAEIEITNNHGCLI